MTTVLESYKKQSKKKKDGDIMGLIRILFPDIEAETFMNNRNKR